MKKLNELNFNDIVICDDCGLVWHLETAKKDQHDWNKNMQEARCRCGNKIYDERDD